MWQVEKDWFLRILNEDYPNVEMPYGEETMGNLISKILNDYDLYLLYLSYFSSFFEDSISLEKEVEGNDIADIERICSELEGEW